MKKFALIAMAAAATIATPAAAQSVTGTITLTGVVGPKCFVVPGSGSTFSDSVDFLALDAADGTLRSGLATDFGTRTFTVKCTSANPGLSITATPLAIAPAPTAAAGYDSSIDYSATLTVDTTAGSTAVTDASSTAGATTGSAGAPLANAAGNVRVTTAGYATNNATDLLVAGTYNGVITVVISPN